MTRRPRTPFPIVPLELVAGTEPIADPRVRPDRVAQAKERIRLRYYERPDVTRALVEAVLVELAAP
jgi:hypothetical protein